MSATPLQGRVDAIVRNGTFVLAATLAFSGITQADILDNTVQAEQRITQDAQRTQQQVEQVANQTEDLVAQYRRVLREVENLEAYNQQLQRVVNNQRQEISSIDSQLENLEETNRGVVPLMLEMVDMLDRIVEADIPFDIDTRRDIVEDLRSQLDQADITESEKYRQIMEAYQRELDYGRNFSAYEGQVPGGDRRVEFLQVGRTLLIYQTLTGDETGWFNPSSRQFETLPADYGFAVTEALRIAKNQAAPNLVRLPTPGAQAAGGN